MKRLDAQTASAYQGMALVYDALIEDVDYKAWFNSVQNVIKQVSATRTLPYKVLELGAGTGNMTEFLVGAGSMVTAIEPSEPMLSVLQEKMCDQMGRMRFFNGTLNEFSTKEQFDGAYAFLDVINYISPKDLKSAFEKLYSLLKPKGLLVFDISTPHKLQNILGNHIFAENHEDFAYIWENHYDSKNRVLSFEFALFSEREDGLFERQLEVHSQYAHSHEDIVHAAEGAGFTVSAYYGDDHSSWQIQCERWHYYLTKA